MRIRAHHLLGLALCVAAWPRPAAAQLRGEVIWRGRAAAGGVVEWIPSRGARPAQEPDTVLVDQRSLRFRPSVLGVRAGTVVRFQNSDAILHNVFSPAERGDDFDLGTYAVGETRDHVFARPGSYVVLCHVHPEMALWVVVSGGPWLAVTDGEGRFLIEDAPPGPGRLVTWLRRRPVREDTLTAPPDRPLIIEIPSR